MRIAIAGATGLIGAKLVELARSQGHEVLPLSRRSGYDLTDSSVVEKLTHDLEGVDAVVDVTQGSDFDDAALEQFFVDVAHNLGKAATKAGVPRTVVLSIVGIDRTPDYGYYVAKVAQEKAHRASSPGVQILRATQFHEFPAQNIEWFTQDGVASIMDVQTQPIASDEVIALLLDMATGAQDGDVQVAGPQPESLVALAQQVVAGDGLDVRIEAEQPPASMVENGMLPQVEDHVIVRGPSWEDWYSQQH